jgi:CHAT domain-containing protein/tetratricopeptide (TPR) repeat protein
MTLVRTILAAPDRDEAHRLIEASSPEALREAVEPMASEILRLLRVNPHEALEAAERTELVAKASGGVAERARARWVRGHAFATLLRSREALTCYRDAASTYEELGRTGDVARIAIGRVNVLTYQGRYGEALELGERARRDLIATGQEAAAASMDQNLGNLHHRIEKPQAALRRYDRALRVAERVCEPPAIRIIKLNRATALSALGKLDRAERIYEDLGREAAEAGERRVSAFADFNLGYIRFQKGDYGRAYDTLDAARRTFEELHDDHWRVLTLIDLVELLLEVNRFGPARDLARDAGGLAERIGLRFERGRAALFEGIAALGLGAEDEAESMLDVAVRSFREEGNNASEAVADMYLAEVAARREDPGGARRFLRRAIGVFRSERMKLHEGAARLRLAALELDRRRLEPARQEIRQAGSALRLVPAPWLASRLSHLRGRVAEKRQEPGAAIRHYRQAVERIESIRGRIGVDEFRVSFAEDKAPVYADLATTILRRGGPRAVADAFAVVEQGRSRSLVDLLQGRLAAAAADDEKAARLLARMEKLRGEINRLTGFDRASNGERRELRRTGPSGPIREREAEVTELMRRLQRRNAGVGALAGGETVTLAQVQDTLAEDTTLVEYFCSPRGSWAFVVRKDDARAVRLRVSSDEIVRSLHRLRFQIEKGCYGREYALARSAGWHDAVDRHLRGLAERVWKPLELPEGRAIVVPHGPLHSLPFAALPLENGDRVIDRHVLSHLPSASAGRYLAPPPGRPRDDRDLRVLAVEVTDESIPGARIEVDEVRRAFRRGQVLRGKRATAREFKRAAPDADVVHIATHGMFRGDDPAFSSLRLADGWMSLHEVYGLRLAAKLVCVSACQSGRNWVGAGDELVGLTRGFLHAGAGSLLVSLWPVDDEATARLMIRFYRGLRRGGPIDETLRAAMLEVREELPHPYYWSPFLLVGGGGARLTKS